MRGVWIGLAFLVGCTPARRQVRGDIVRSINFSGNGAVFSGHNDYQLITQMESEDSAFGITTWPVSLFVEPKQLRRDVLVRDSYRLEVWYAHHGWLDAHFDGWSVHRARRQTDRKAGVVDLHGRIVTGPRSLVRALDIEGVSGASKVLVDSVVSAGSVRSGDPFDLELARTAAASIETRLQQGGYAYADVQLGLDAYPEEQAVDLALKVDTGIPAKFGAIEIVGSRKVPERFVREALNLEEGSPYRLDQLGKAQSRVFALDTFSLVTVQPDLSDPTQRDIPITATVTENKFRSLRFGAGLKIENTNWEPRLTSSFKHTNVLGRLIQFKVDGAVGVSGYTPLSDAGSNPTPVWRVGGSVTYPRLFHRTLSQQLQAEVVRDLDQSLVEYFNPEIDFRTVFKPSNVVLLSLGPHLEIFEYPKIADQPEALAQARAAYGEDFEQRYRITSIDFGFTLDWRDSSFNTKRGSFFNTTIRAAFPLQEGDYSFAAISGDWRLFRPVPLGDSVPLTLATRLHGKVVIPVGDSGLPYPELAFLGGASDMRGFPTQGMGPYRTYVLADDTRFVPVGGTLGLVFSQELRYAAGGGLTYAAFTDIATLANPGRNVGNGAELGLLNDVFQTARAAVGVGVRYNSSIGPLRLDLAMRPYAFEDCGPLDDPLACRDPDSTNQRRLDLIRALDRDSVLPGLMIFFAFGEAI